MKFRISLLVSITESMGFSQSLLRIPADGDLKNFTSWPEPRFVDESPKI